MPAYQVAICKITNRTPGFLEYVQKSAVLLPKFGASYVVRGPADTVQEGDYLKGAAVIVTKWPSVEACRNFYNSPDYQAIKALREGSGIYDIGLYPEAPQ
jgi:uncharacterized protein (DUF1330 family)